MTTPELVLMALTDARLPTGGHTQSAGLEPAVHAGLAADGRRLHEVVDYARDRLRTVVRVDAGAAVVARFLSRSGGDPLRVEPHWAARTPSAVLRAASRRQGRGCLRLAARIWPAVLDHLPADAEIARPVVMGVVAAVTGLSAEQTALMVGYDDAQTVVAAALKLLPVDPVEAAGWGVALHPQIAELAADLSDLIEPERISGAGAPLVDVFAEQHSRRRLRLFHA
ncbi:urease accessory UreF family protein [Nocardioides sp. HM23]|uniref:urease accessory protein UreF n=1 Tax=Nocardioides bizhenqiangii TaxID=3095076 RepID=UPI002ACA9573|nr:urease accessory UreF family protein [Nocardioides sp. HM23]MDZ5620042.1 urease accessory UreF family protein [Nocardioides sp. HM23]